MVFSQGMPNGKTEDWVAWRMAGLGTLATKVRVRPAVSDLRDYTDQQTNKKAATELAIL